MTIKDGRLDSSEGVNIPKVPTMLLFRWTLMCKMNFEIGRYNKNKDTLIYNGYEFTKKQQTKTTVHWICRYNRQLSFVNNRTFVILMQMLSFENDNSTFNVSDLTFLAASRNRLSEFTWKFNLSALIFVMRCQVRTADRLSFSK